MRKTIPIILCLLLGIEPSLASTYQSLDHLRQKIEAHVTQGLKEFSNKGGLKVTTGAIDSRLHLPACADDQLVVFNPYNTPLIRTSTMGIKCEEATKHWTIYVPIDITLLRKVIAARRHIARGTRISASDVFETDMDTQHLNRGYYTDLKKVTGYITKQHIKEGSALSPYNLQLPKLVHKGEHVSIVAKSKSFHVSMEGIALGEGIMGEFIKVKNLSSKRVIEAAVTSRKVVEIVI